MKKILFCIVAMIAAFASCTGEKPVAGAEQTAKTEAENDSMIYGLSCDGTNDSVIVFLPFKDGADPVSYNIEVAKAEGRVIGQPQIGDWVGIMLNPADTTEATMVINLDQLKATWTYSVRPTWKDASKLSRRALARKLNEIPDSLREAYMVPREYGFTLQRGHVAKAVGRVRRESSLEDDSPVEYPAVKNYTGWKTLNGQLILISTDRQELPLASLDKDKAEKPAPKPKEFYDTLRFVMMTADSLVVQTSQHKRLAFHRQENARTANAEAQKAAAKTSKSIK